MVHSKGCAVWESSLDEVINGLAQVSEGGHAQPSQGLTPQDAEPAFHLVEPGGMGRRVMKMDVGMLCQPAVMLRLMGIQVVQDDMKLLSGY